MAVMKARGRNGKKCNNNSGGRRGKGIKNKRVSQPPKDKKRVRLTIETIQFNRKEVEKKKKTKRNK